MTTINSVLVNSIQGNGVSIADKTAVVTKKEPVIAIKPDSLSVKANTGTVPGKDNIEFEKKESHFSPTKVLAELVSSGLNLMVKKEPKAVAVSTEKIIAGAVVQGGKTAGTIAGKAMPVVVTGLNVGITLYDSHDSYKKLKDEKVSLSSKALSVTTVGLDLVTVVAHHLGYGKTAALASVVSIGTSLGSDFCKDK